MEQEKMDYLNKEAIEILGYEKTPDNFTATVMDKIQAEKVPDAAMYNPIIGRWGWLLIFVLFILLIAGFTFLSPDQNQESTLLSDVFLKDWWTKYLHPALNALITTGSHLGLVILIGISATLLLFADRLVGHRLKSRLNYN